MFYVPTDPQAIFNWWLDTLEAFFDERERVLEEIRQRQEDSSFDEGQLRLVQLLFERWLSSKRINRLLLSDKEAAEKFSHWSTRYGPRFDGLPLEQRVTWYANLVRLDAVLHSPIPRQASLEQRQQYRAAKVARETMLEEIESLL